MGFIGESFNKQKGFVNTVSQKEKISKIGLWLDWLWCFVRYGATPSDWYCYELYRYRHNQCRKFITRRKNLELDRIFNPKEFKIHFDDKRIFNEVYSAFVKRNWVCVKNGHVSDLQIPKLTGVVVVKPTSLSSGRGIFTYDLNKNSLDDLLKTIPSGDYLIEEKVELCDELKRLNPPSCNTIRVYTMIDNAGRAQILDAVIRVGGGNTIQDNFHAKGVVYPIDIESGRIKGCGKDLLNNEFLIHPSSGIYMPGYQIPRWPEVMQFAKDAASQNPKARFIGWDIAVTADRCEMIEGNYYVYCGLMQIFDKDGKYKLVKSFI